MFYFRNTTVHTGGRGECDCWCSRARQEMTWVPSPFGYWCESIIIDQRVADRMVATGDCFSHWIFREAPTKEWTGFNGHPLRTNRVAGLSVELCDRVDKASAHLAVHVYVVPVGVMPHDVLLGTDSWKRFPSR